MDNICGFVNLYKEQNYTSNDAVNIVRGIFGRIKTGHTGTLDPMASGVLPICLGKATKLADLVQAKTKVYKASLLLGLKTDTYDIWGKTLEEKDVKAEKEEIIYAIKSFEGNISQLPPMYSAIKIKGKKLYELAREGKNIERVPRNITIYSITDITFNDRKNIDFKIVCSKGTYIRSLCYDIGEKLGCGGTMSALERLASGSFTVENSVKLSELKKLKEENRLNEVIIPPEKIFEDYKIYKPSKDADKFIVNGNKINLGFFKIKPSENESFLLYDSKDKLIGIYKEDGGFVKPVCRLI